MAQDVAFDASCWEYAAKALGWMLTAEGCA